MLNDTRYRYRGRHYTDGRRLDLCCGGVTVNDGGGGGGGDHHAVCSTALSVPHALSSLKISVKYAGSALMRNILADMARTMPRHRSQNASRLSSTRKGFSGYDISLPMYEYAKYRHVSTTACSSGSVATRSSTSSRTSMYTNTTLAGFMNGTSCDNVKNNNIHKSNIIYCIVLLINRNSFSILLFIAVNIFVNTDQALV